MEDTRTSMAWVPLLVAAAVSLSLLVPARACAVPAPGISTHVTWGLSSAERTREIAAVADSGAKWIRFDIGWNNVEPTEGAYSSPELQAMDHAVATARSRGLRVLVVVIATPAWANGGKGRWVPADDDADYTRFMSHMSRRYAGRVSAWELGNEVNETGFFGVPRSASPSRYSRMLEAGYHGVRSGDPSATVVTAGLAGSDANYLRQMYAAGAGGHFDEVGVHPYARTPWFEDPEDPGCTFAGLYGVRAAMSENGDAGKGIWATEIGWGTSVSGVSRAQQGEYVAGTFKRLGSEFPYVETVFVYCLKDRPGMEYGLLSPSFIPKPAWYAYRSAVAAPPARLLSVSVRRVSGGGKAYVSTRGTSTGTAKVQRAVSGRGWVTVASVSPGNWASASKGVAYVSGGRYRAVSGSAVSSEFRAP